MKTFMASPATIDRKWYVVDAEGMTLGRLASEVANAEKIKVTGKKLEQKIYYNHSDYVGGMKETTLKEMLAKHPERVIEHAVKGMLPKGPLGREMYTKLFVYVGPDHKHAAQPLTATETADKFDVLVNVRGGGYTGQAGAIRHGIARALLNVDADYRPVLKKAGFLTRDPRMKERKKYGLKAARRAPQFSKR